MNYSRKVPRKYQEPMEPIPVGEVQESDWAAWEDSVAFQDSLLSGLADSPQPEAPSDAFSSVKKHDA